MTFDEWFAKNTPRDTAYNRTDMKRGWEGAIAQYERSDAYEVRSMPKTGDHEWGPWCRIEGRYVNLFRSADILDIWYVQIRQIHTTDLK